MGVGEGEAEAGLLVGQYQLSSLDCNCHDPRSGALSFAKIRSDDFDLLCEGGEMLDRFRTEPSRINRGEYTPLQDAPACAELCGVTRKSL